MSAEHERIVAGTRTENVKPSAKKANGKGTEQRAIILRTAAEIAAEPQLAVWLIKDLLERNALLLMFGELGSLKSFLALDWALRIADCGEPVVYLHAEGRGLWKRLRAWALQRYPGTSWHTTLERLPFRAVERPVNLSADEVVEHLLAAIDALGIKPVLIVVDTMTRNSDGTVERSNEDAQVYLNRLDNRVRTVYGCSVLLVHHVGHTNQDRARGPYSLMANTDCFYMVERPDADKLEIIVKVGRMKDGQPPPSMQYTAEVISLDETEEGGQSVTSLTLTLTGPAPIDAAKKKKTLGKNQQAAIAAIAEWARAHPDAAIISNDELRDVLAGQGIKARNRRAEVIDTLVNIGLLTPSVGGHHVNRSAL